MKIFKTVWFVSLMGIFLAGIPALTPAKDSFSTAPITNKGSKWRIGYYEGGNYIEYAQTLSALIRELMVQGWIENAEIPASDDGQTRNIWNWLAKDIKSRQLEFVKDAYYNSEWNKELRIKTATDIIERLNSRKDIDLMIAMGTWAGMDLANDRHKTNTILLAVSDAVSSGIVKSAEDSGYDHIHARVDPLRYERQVRIFHEIIGFRKLGVTYKDTPDGKSYAAIDKVEKVAKERGFEIERCFLHPDVNVANQSTVECFQKLAKNTDAIYVTMHKGINKETIPELVKIFNAARIPSFSQSGSEEVKYGFLMSISQAGFRYVGKFYAETIAKIFNGAKPRELGQVFEDPPKIAINMKTAELIGYDPPVDVLGAADEIYQEILGN